MTKILAAQGGNVNEKKSKKDKTCIMSKIQAGNVGEKKNRVVTYFKSLIETMVASVDELEKELPCDITYYTSRDRIFNAECKQFREAVSSMQHTMEAITIIERYGGPCPPFETLLRWQSIELRSSSMTYKRLLEEMTDSKMCSRSEQNQRILDAEYKLNMLRDPLYPEPVSNVYRKRTYFSYRIKDRSMKEITTTDAAVLIKKQWKRKRCS